MDISARVGWTKRAYAIGILHAYKKLMMEKTQQQPKNYNIKTTKRERRTKHTHICCVDME